MTVLNSISPSYLQINDNLNNTTKEKEQMSEAAPEALKHQLNGHVDNIHSKKSLLFPPLPFPLLPFITFIENKWSK